MAFIVGVSVTPVVLDFLGSMLTAIADPQSSVERTDCPHCQTLVETYLLGIELDAAVQIAPLLLHAFRVRNKINESTPLERFCN